MADAARVWTVEDHLRDQPAASVAMWHRFVELIERNGPIAVVSPSKTTITFKGTRRGFAGARPTAQGIRVYFDLQRVLEDPRVRGGAPYGHGLFVHHATFTSIEQLDDEVAGWLAEAYAVGAGAHLS